MNIKTLIKGSILFLIASILAKGISYFNRLYITKFLSVEYVGLFYAVFSFVSVLAVFRTAAMNQAIMKFVSHYRAKGEKGVAKRVAMYGYMIQMFLAIVIIAIVFMTSNWLGDNYFHSKTAKWLLPFMSCFLLTSIKVSPLLNGYHKLELLKYIEPLKSILVLLVLYSGFKTAVNVTVPVAAYVFVGVFIWLASIPYLFTLDKGVKIKDKDGLLRKMLVFSAPLVLSSTGGILIGHIGTIVLTVTKTLYDVGVYNIVLPTALLVSIIGSSLGVMILPLVSDLNAKKEYTKIRNGLFKSYTYILGALIPVLIVVFIFAKQIILLLYGEQYAVGYIAFRILLIGVGFLTIKHLNSRVLIGLGRTKDVMFMTLVPAIFSIILCILMVPNLGIIGAAFATTTSYFIACMMSTIMLVKFFRGVRNYG